jgi:hypothetical protein
MAASGGGAPITLGSAGPGDHDNTQGANFMQGATFQATESGTVNYLNILGPTDIASSVNYILALYDAASSTVWSGALIGRTAPTNGLGISESKKIVMLAPASIVAGNWYGLGILPAASMKTRTFVSGGRYFSDSYASGPTDPAPATSALGPRPIIWATTT